MNRSERIQYLPGASDGGEPPVSQAERAQRPVSTATWLLESLRTSILDGTRPAHSVIRQEELAAMYGVSRMPVREALRSLEAEGLVVHRPSRGVVVAPLDPDDALEIFEIRASLESLALRRSIPRLRDDQRAAASLALRTLEQSSPEQASSAHRAFHLWLSAAAGDRLQKLIGQYIDACARYLRIEATLVETVDKDRYEHRALLEATLAGDVRGATRLIERHVAGTGNEIAEVLRNRDAVERTSLT
jgi:DNA-binding GntR family transcriptional regulator